MSKGIEGLANIRKKIPQGKSVTLVGGAFDLLHPGHLHVIEHAKNLGDVLVVSVLSDAHVKSYKGDRRPILPQEHRLKMVESLKPVDHAFIPDTSSYSLENLETLRPDHLVFGKESGEDRNKKVEMQKEEIRSRFPNIRFHDVERYHDDSISTGKLIKKISDL